MSLRSILISASLRGLPSSPFTSPESEEVCANAPAESTNRAPRAQNDLAEFTCMRTDLQLLLTASQLHRILQAARRMLASAGRSPRRTTPPDPQVTERQRIRANGDGGAYELG